MSDRMTTKFRVRLYGFNARGIPSKDRNGKSDPFLNCNFDNFKTFKSEIIKKTLDPEWKFSLEFFYETRYANKLDLKIFKIDCFDYDRVGANDFIGGAQINLHTLATGPISHDLVLRDGGKPCGRLQFCCEFEMYSEVEVTLKSIHVSALVAPEPGKPCDPHMQFYFSAVDAIEEAPLGSSLFPQRAKVENKTYRTPQLTDTLTPSWAQCEQMWFLATLRELMAESIVVKICQSKTIRGSTMIGGCELALRKYLHPSTERKQITFREVLRGPDGGAGVGVIEGVVIFTNVPSLAQMKGGLHTDAGVEGGEVLLPGLPMPNNIVGSVLNAADIAKVVHGAVDAAEIVHGTVGDAVAPITAAPDAANSPPTGVAALAVGAATDTRAAAATDESPPMLPTRRGHLKETIANRRHGMPRVTKDKDNNFDDEDPTVLPPGPIGALHTSKPTSVITPDAEDNDDVLPPGPIGAVLHGAPQDDAEDDDNAQPPPAVGMVNRSQHPLPQASFCPQQQQQAYGGGGYGQQLPPGWEARTHESGQPFYVDHNTPQTLWSLPINMWQPHR